MTVTDENMVKQILSTESIQPYPVFVTDSNTIQCLDELSVEKRATFAENIYFKYLQDITGTDKEYIYSISEPQRQELRDCVDLRQSGCVGCAYMDINAQKLMCFIPQEYLLQHTKHIAEYVLQTKHSDKVIYLNSDPFISIVQEDMYISVTKFIRDDQRQFTQQDVVTIYSSALSNDEAADLVTATTALSHDI